MSRSYQVMMPHIIPDDMQSYDPVRMVGRFKSYDAAQDELVLEYKSHSIIVRTSCLEPTSFDTMYQLEVYGDLHLSQNPAEGNSHANMFVEAKFLRCIDNMDLNLYERIVPILRDIRLQK